jgi:hypothetical protein
MPPAELEVEPIGSALPRGTCAGRLPVIAPAARELPVPRGATVTGVAAAMCRGAAGRGERLARRGRTGAFGPSAAGLQRARSRACRADRTRENAARVSPGAAVTAPSGLEPARAAGRIWPKARARASDTAAVHVQQRLPADRGRARRAHDLRGAAALGRCRSRLLGLARDTGGVGPAVALPPAPPFAPRSQPARLSRPRVQRGEGGSHAHPDVGRLVPLRRRRGAPPDASQGARAGARRRRTRSA